MHLLLSEPLRGHAGAHPVLRHAAHHLLRRQAAHHLLLRHAAHHLLRRHAPSSAAAACRPSSAAAACRHHLLLRRHAHHLLLRHPHPGCARDAFPASRSHPRRPGRDHAGSMAGFPGAAAVGFSGSASPREIPRDFSSISSMADFGFSGALVGAGAELAMNSPPAKGSIAEGMPIEAPPLLIAPNGSSGGAAVTSHQNPSGAGAAATERQRVQWARAVGVVEDGPMAWKG